MQATWERVPIWRAVTGPDQDNDSKAPRSPRVSPSRRVRRLPHDLGALRCGGDRLAVDGLRATLLRLNGAIRDYCFAARLKGAPDPVATQFFLPPGPNVTYSACLVARIEEIRATGSAPYPAERTLLVSGILESCLASRRHGHQRRPTPHLSVTYRAPAESHHARA
jgi:hypothetical protein